MRGTSNTEWLTTRRCWDWPAAGLLILAILTASQRLIATDWTANLNHIQNLTLIGTIIGLATGYSCFKGFTSFTIGLAYGLLAIPWQLGQIMGEEIEWKERLSSISGRMAYSIDLVVRDKNVADPILFLVLMAILYWILSITAGYNLSRKRNPWGGIIPSGLTIVIVHSFDHLDPMRTLYLAFYLVCAMVLVSRIHYLNQRERWQEQQTHIPMYMGMDMMRVTTGAVLALILLAWTAPSLTPSLKSIRRIWSTPNQPWQEVAERIEKAFKSLQVSSGYVPDYYGESLALGRGNTFSDQVVLTIKTPIRRSDNIRFYWRARVYDYYDEGQWEGTFPKKETFVPDSTTLDYPIYDGRWDTTFFVTVGSPISVLYTASQPTWISRPAEMLVSHKHDGRLEIAAFRTDDLVRTGETYQFSASITDASIMQLRNAGADYPEWVTDRYLQVPNSITTRTIELANQITEGIENPYDMVKTITQYLRRNIVYTEKVPPLPIKQDPIDWILFDLEEGFCNYYATAEIILLRSLGIPSRLAVGYAEGENTGVEADMPANKNSRDIRIIGKTTKLFESFTVRQKNAHAWPEVYFPGTGWVEFEPTPNQLPITRTLRDERQNGSAERINDSSELENATARPENTNILEGDLVQGESTQRERDSGLSPTFRYIIITASIILMSLALFRRAVRKGRAQPLPVVVEYGFRKMNIEPPKFLVLLARNAKQPPIGKAYTEINRALNRLGQPAKIDATPADRAAALIKLLPEVKPQVKRLLNEYQTNVYSQKAGNPKIAMEASRVVRIASSLMRFKNWLGRFRTHGRG